MAESLAQAPPEVERQPCPLGWTVGSLLDLGDQYLVVGSFLDPRDGAAGSQTWWSRDSLAWVDLGRSTVGDLITAEGPAGVIGIGRQNGKPAVEVWRLDGLASVR